MYLYFIGKFRNKSNLSFRSMRGWFEYIYQIYMIVIICGYIRFYHHQMIKQCWEIELQHNLQSEMCT